MFKESTLRGLSNCALDRDPEQCVMGGSKEWMKSVVVLNSKNSTSLMDKCTRGPPEEQYEIDHKGAVFKTVNL